MFTLIYYLWIVIYWCSATGEAVVEHKISEFATPPSNVVVRQCFPEECNKQCIENGQYGCCEHQNCICYEPKRMFQCPHTSLP
jgi:hypothetical protein